jgi:hypothetical protein
MSLDAAQRMIRPHARLGREVAEHLALRIHLTAYRFTFRVQSLHSILREIVIQHVLHQAARLDVNRVDERRDFDCDTPLTVARAHKHAHTKLVCE